MHMFGLYSYKPLAVARISGMKLLRVNKRDSPTTNPHHFLRHAGAVSAAIAKNMSTVMSQTSELVHTSGVRPDPPGVDHNQYSFIAVVALMSLFLVITISATGLLLAFCRKKNTVFTAPAKSETDSQFELDDIDNSDVEMCRGEKGECYYHLSDEYDEDDEDEEDDDDDDDDKDKPDSKPSRIFNAKKAKRSRTFPQIPNGIGNVKGSNPVTNASTAMTPLIQQCQGHRQQCSRAGGCSSTLVLDSTFVTTHSLEHQHANPYSNNNRFRQATRTVVCHNPNHQHFQHQHHNCHYNRPHYHHRQRRNNLRPQLARLYRNQLPYHGGAKLQRSHTIHDIPQTGTESKSPLNKCGVKIQVIDAEHVMKSTPQDATTQYINPTHIPTISSTISTQPTTEDTIDIFHEEEESFNNLKLRLEDFQHTGAEIAEDSHNSETNVISLCNTDPFDVHVITASDKPGPSSSSSQSIPVPGGIFSRSSTLSQFFPHSKDPPPDCLHAPRNGIITKHGDATSATTATQETLVKPIDATTVCSVTPNNHTLSNTQNSDSRTATNLTKQHPSTLTRRRAPVKTPSTTRPAAHVSIPPPPPSKRQQAIKPLPAPTTNFRTTRSLSNNPQTNPALLRHTPQQPSKTKSTQETHLNKNKPTDLTKPDTRISALSLTCPCETLNGTSPKSVTSCTTTARDRPTDPEVTETTLTWLEHEDEAANGEAPERRRLVCSDTVCSDTVCSDTVCGDDTLHVCEKVSNDALLEDDEDDQTASLLK